MIIKSYSKYSISLRSLLVIVGLQLVAMSLQAMPFNLSQEPCDHSLMTDGMNDHHSSNHNHSSANSSDFCPHCEKVNFDCDNKCFTSDLMFLVYNSEIYSDNVHFFYNIKENKSFFAVSQQPKLRPPRQYYLFQ